MSISSTMLKVIAALVAMFTTGGSAVWYASAKSTAIDQQEKHLEFNDARINALDAKIQAMELDIVRLQDVTRSH